MIKHLLFQLNDLLFQITRAQDGTTTVLAFTLCDFRTARHMAGAFKNVHDISFDADRDDVVRLVVRQLLIAPAIGFIDSPPHGAGYAIRVQDGLAVQVPRRSANGLNQRPVRPQETFLVRIQYRHQ